MSWRKADFLRVLGEAHRAEKHWVETCRTAGGAVAHGKKLVLPNHNPRTDFCPTPDCVGLVAIEVKLRGLKFTGPKDYPYDTVFVDDESGLKNGPQPWAWVFLSKPTGAWCWISALDRDDSWEFQDIWDSMRGFKVSTLVAPTKFLRPADTLLQYLCTEDQLQWVDGDMQAFRQDGGDGEGDGEAKSNPNL